MTYMTDKATDFSAGKSFRGTAWPLGMLPAVAPACFHDRSSTAMCCSSCSLCTALQPLLTAHSAAASTTNSRKSWVSSEAAMHSMVYQFQYQPELTEYSGEDLPAHECGTRHNKGSAATLSISCQRAFPVPAVATGAGRSLGLPRGCTS